MIEIFQIVNYIPAAAAAFDFSTPFGHAPLVFFRIDVVGPQFGNIERNHIESLQLKGNVAFIPFGQFLLEIREY